MAAGVVEVSNSCITREQQIQCMMCSKYMHTGYVQCGSSILKYILMHYFTLIACNTVGRVIQPIGKSTVVFSNPDPLNKPWYYTKRSSYTRSHRLGTTQVQWMALTKPGSSMSGSYSLCRRDVSLLLQMLLG